MDAHTDMAKSERGTGRKSDERDGSTTTPPQQAPAARKSRGRVFHAAAMYGLSLGSDGRSWAVSLVREGVCLYKSFSFSIYGGEKEALLRAQAWRDEMVREHPPVSRQSLAEKVRRNNKSGIPGVSCMRDAQGEPTGWIAQTHLGTGNHVSKYFGVARFGPVEAKLLAIAERQKQLQQMTGLRRIHPGEPLVRAAPPLPPETLPQAVARGATLLSTNTSGLAGVALLTDKKGRARRWIATTRVGDKQMSSGFSVMVHGYEQAKALAIEARNRQLQTRAESHAGKTAAAPGGRPRLARGRRAST